MRPVIDAALEVQHHLRRDREKFCFIGGIALQRWGHPRFTQDVDVTLLCDLGDEATAIDRVLARFEPRMPDARKFALKNRVILVVSAGGIPIDIALGALPFEKRCVRRASEFDFGGGTRLLTCSAEDLVVLKAFAGRTHDWADIESILVRQKRRLDWKRVFGELQKLLELRDAPETLERVRRLRDTTKS